MDDRSIFHALRRRFLALLLSLLRRVLGKPDDFSVGIHELWRGARPSRHHEALEQLDPSASFVFEGSDADGRFFFVDLRLDGDFASAFVVFRVDGNIFVSEESRSRVRRSRSAIRIGILHLECRHPLRMWRLQVRGTMKSPTSKEERFVKLSGWWGPTGVPCHSFADLDPTHSAEGLDRVTLLEAAEAYRRALSIKDFVHFGEFRCHFEEREFFLRGVRIRQFPGAGDADLRNLFSCYFENGDRVFFHHSEHLDPGFCLEGGHFFGADLLTHRLRTFDADVLFDDDIEDGISFSSGPHGKRVFRVSKGDHLRFFYERADGTRVTVRRMLLEHEAKGSRGFGLIINELAPTEKRSRALGDEEEVLKDHQATAEARKKTVVALGDRDCEDPSSAGGKGANLAKLTRIGEHFEVPKGCVVTIAAFEKHLKANRDLKEEIRKLDENQKGTSLDEAVGRISEEFDRTELQDDLRREISIRLASIFGDFDEVRFAVRSSAVGEDGAELSSAGQMETYLNVTGLHEIARSVVECWKSNFRREALSYRRQYGQVLNPPMAVVIQEMVDGGIAGVLFTNHPVSGDPDLMVLNVVKGIGEDLVAGRVTPTEIVLSKKLEVISMDHADTVAEEQAKKIGEVGLHLERRLGNPQDIEFVVKGDRLFTVQSRDITNLDLETRWELLHEFDTPLLSDQELITRANVGEVLPNAMTPLSITAALETYELGIRASMEVIEGGDRLRYPCFVATAMYRQKNFMNLTDMYLKGWKSVEKNPIFEFNLAGTRIFTEEMFLIGKQRYPAISDYRLLKQLLRGLKLMLFDSYRRLNNAKSRVANTPLAEIDMDVKELLDLAHTQRDILVETVADHTIESVFSSFTYHFVASLLRGSSEGELSPETLSDIATVYSASKNAVISADVPTSLENIAKQMIEEKLSEEFETIEDDSEALQWLQDRSEGRTAGMVAEFLESHGHRGFNELDIGGVTWGRNPAQLAQTLKAMLSNPSSHVKEAPGDVDSIIEKLNCTATGIKRRVLMFFIREAHRGVEFREAAKNLLVKATDNLRETLLLVGQKLHGQNMLPDPRLILFFTLREVAEYVETRSARIITRAHKREKLLSAQDAEDYSLMYIGRPSPKEKKVDLAAGTRLLGTPVCQGVVRGKARVARNLEEARDTQPGEILITKYTDIAWSPLFPLIRGLVTEIGGLLSHGSVVAREYGLPSLIAVKSATDFFRTGDEVLLDSRSGFVARAAKEEKCS
ncbi:hypothetical protein QR680_005622 [Steinernema hermaphroditum]|uniref:Phosphoenolpyruvate synthase n=1 Tax=Steinernema hermaphroditum TaxID=289476 RepID=A0AA39HU48_9BILA|nr:hypothetical protein QR680_005622 [Steinernema hermaphroditum]